MTELRRIPVAGIELAVHLDGSEGSPVVTLLNSLGADARMWNTQVAALRDNYRVLRIDTRGHGSSDAGAPYDLRTLADDVVAVWDALGVARSSVVGLSLGGMLAVDIGLREPGRVAKLVVCDCRLDAPAPFLANFDRRLQALEEDGMSAVADITLPSWVVTPALRDRASGAWVREMIQSTRPDAYRGIVAGFSALDLKQKLGALASPALFVCGGEDVALDEMRGFATLAPRARFQEIPNAGHLANLDQPAMFNQAMLGFLSVSQAP